MTLALVRYTREAYIDVYGHRHPAKRITRHVKRTHKKRTPKARRWYRPTIHMGWKKTQSASVRRELALEAHEGDELAAARALQSLANVSQDTTTKKLAAADAKHFFREHKKG